LFAEGGVAYGESSLFDFFSTVWFVVKIVYAQKKAYAAIQTLVTFHPLFQRTISSILSCNQNIGPTRSMNRLKLTVNMGTERGSREDNRVFICCFARGLEGPWRGGFDGREESKIWGIKFTAFFAGEETMEGADSVLRCIIGGGCGREVTILGARRISCILFL
jgi:hypothetical protein